MKMTKPMGMWPRFSMTTWLSMTTKMKASWWWTSHCCAKMDWTCRMRKQLLWQRNHCSWNMKPTCCVDMAKEKDMEVFKPSASSRSAASFPSRSAEPDLPSWKPERSAESVVRKATGVAMPHAQRGIAKVDPRRAQAQVPLQQSRAIQLAEENMVESRTNHVWCTFHIVVMIQEPMDGATWQWSPSPMRPRYPKELDQRPGVHAFLPLLPWRVRLCLRALRRPHLCQLLELLRTLWPTSWLLQLRAIQWHHDHAWKNLFVVAMKLGATTKRLDRSLTATAQRLRLHQTQQMSMSFQSSCALDLKRSKAHLCLHRQKLQVSIWLWMTGTLPCCWMPWPRNRRQLFMELCINWETWRWKLMAKGWLLRSTCHRISRCSTLRTSCRPLKPWKKHEEISWRNGWTPTSLITRTMRRRIRSDGVSSMQDILFPMPRMRWTSSAGVPTCWLVSDLSCNLCPSLCQHQCQVHHPQLLFLFQHLCNLMEDMFALTRTSHEKGRTNMWKWSLAKTAEKSSSEFPRMASCLLVQMLPKQHNKQPALTFASVGRDRMDTSGATHAWLAERWLLDTMLTRGLEWQGVPLPCHDLQLVDRHPMAISPLTRCRRFSVRARLWPVWRLVRMAVNRCHPPQCIEFWMLSAPPLQWMLPWPQPCRALSALTWTTRTTRPSHLENSKAEPSRMCMTMKSPMSPGA